MSKVIAVKVFVSIAWVVLQIAGNIIFAGIYDFERRGGDPMKRNIIDMVKNHKAKSTPNTFFHSAHINRSFLWNR